MYSSTAAGFHDVFGNVWEWTEDHFNGLPGYASDPIYDDFSAPCFDGRHTLMMVGTPHCSLCRFQAAASPLPV